jgi:hypothetical protein
VGIEKSRMNFLGDPSFGYDAKKYEPNTPVTIE